MSATVCESPEPEATVTQSADLPQQRPSGEEQTDHGQIQEARLNRLRRNWQEAAMADLPVEVVSKTIRFKTKG